MKTLNGAYPHNALGKLGDRGSAIIVASNGFPFAIGHTRGYGNHFIRC